MFSDKNMQCSVCMDDFKLEEEARQLPCSHHYHNDCIVPWLELVSLTEHIYIFWPIYVIHCKGQHISCF